MHLRIPWIRTAISTSPKSATAAPINSARGRAPIHWNRSVSRSTQPGSRARCALIPSGSTEHLEKLRAIGWIIMGESRLSGGTGPFIEYASITRSIRPISSPVKVPVGVSRRSRRQSARRGDLALELVSIATLTKLTSATSPCVTGGETSIFGVGRGRSLNDLGTQGSK
jgi:hypothetical protein